MTTVSRDGSAVAISRHTVLSCNCEQSPTSPVWSNDSCTVRCGPVTCVLSHHNEQSPTSPLWSNDSCTVLSQRTVTDQSVVVQ